MACFEGLSRHRVEAIVTPLSWYRVNMTVVTG